MRLKEQVDLLVRAALEAVDPALAIRKATRREGNLLLIGGQQCPITGQPSVDMTEDACKRYDLSRYERVFVIGGGKAGAPMAQALNEVLGGKLTAGWINVKHEHLAEGPMAAALKIHEAGHPVPDEAGLLGARQVLRLAEEAGERDLIFCLISGGGSALLPLPSEGISLGDLQVLTNVLLRCGATINQINTVRKHCSQIKGGQLARAAFPATVVSLILSDVVGNPLDVIASGPTVPDSTTFADAYSVLQEYDVLNAIPESVLMHLRDGLRGAVQETPKPGDPIFDRVENVVVGSNAIAARAAQGAAQSLGYHTLVLSTFIEGEAREVALVMSGIAKSLAVEDWPLPKPACVIAGGETTVTVRGTGTGGRNQELALAAALALDGWPSVAIVTLATDGTDGPTDAAGAIVTGETLSRAQKKGMSATDFLARNDSYAFFDRLDDLIRTGPTNTNVNDLLFILAWEVNFT